MVEDSTLDIRATQVCVFEVYSDELAFSNVTLTHADTLHFGVDDTHVAHIRAIEIETTEVHRMFLASFQDEAREIRTAFTAAVPLAVVLP